MLLLAPVQVFKYLNEISIWQTQASCLHTGPPFSAILRESPEELDTLASPSVSNLAPTPAPPCLLNHRQHGRHIPQSFWSQNPPSKVIGWGVQKPRLLLSPGQNWRSPPAPNSHSSRGAEETEKKKKHCEMLTWSPAKSVPSMGTCLFNWLDWQGQRCFLFASIPDAWSRFSLKAFLKWITASCLKQDNLTDRVVYIFMHDGCEHWSLSYVVSQ